MYLLIVTLHNLKKLTDIYLHFIHFQNFTGTIVVRTMLYISSMGLLLPFKKKPPEIIVTIYFFLIERLGKCCRITTEVEICV